MTIVGGGASSTIIDGNGNLTGDRVMFVSLNTSVSISGVTIQHGRGFGGGGVYCQGCSLAMKDSAVLDNDAQGNVGGGILVGGPVPASVTIEGSTIAGNAAEAGGGVFLAGGAISIVNSTVSGNRAYGDGGGIVAYLGGVSLYNVTVAGNRADVGLDGMPDGVGKGGGLAVRSDSAPLRFRNSIIAGNRETREFQDNWLGVARSSPRSGPALQGAGPR